MTQQKSEDRTVPKGRRKSAPTRGLERPGGGRAVPVEGEDQQLTLSFTTAENLRGHRRADGVRNPDLSGARARKAPKVKTTQRRSGPARMDPSR